MDLIKIDNELKMSTREIAKLTKKRHDNVLRDTREMLSKLKLDSSNLRSAYTTKQGKEFEEFLLNEELVLTLISGYSVELRNAIIKRWQELERKSHPSRKESRQLSKESFTPMVEAVKTTRELLGKQVEPHHFMIESKLIAMVLTGMTPDKYRKLKEVGSFRESLSVEELGWLNRLQCINTGLIHASWEYPRRKEYLMNYHETHKNSFQIVRGSKQLAKAA